MADNKYEKVVDLLLSKKEFFSYTEEDSKLIIKLWSAYWKKRKGAIRSSAEVQAAAILWQYSSDNYLWENDKKWTQKAIADLFQVKTKTIGDNSRQIRRLLKIGYFDDRYCRKEVAENNPMKQMAMTPEGFILPKETVMERGLPFIPMKKDKEDHYFDGMDCLDGGDNTKARYYFKKALEIDDEYVDAYNGMGTVYWRDNLKKAKEYFKKAYELTQKHFNNKWPKEINWGIIENRQFLRSIQYYGLALWREGNYEEAKELFLLLLKFNPDDNQGARYLVSAVYAGLKWEQVEDYDLEKNEKLLEEQNKKYNFWDSKKIMRTEDYMKEDKLIDDENGLWEEGGFAETLGPLDIKEKMKTFHKNHDEDMNYNCKKCNKKISAHNKDWHAGICDDCFNMEF